MRRPSGWGRGRAALGRFAHRHRGEPFTAHQHIDATPEQILDVLSDPRAVKRWFPLPCDFEQDVTRLREGETYAATGRLAGRPVKSQLRVLEATPEHVAVRLAGPVVFDLDVALSAVGGGTEADIRVSVHPGAGLSGRLLAPAASALLRAGALTHTIADIRREAEAR